MNNPYRARPGRPRVDHTGVSNYPVQPNKAAWPQISGPQSLPTVPVYQPQQPVITQPKSTGDPWDWGGDTADNGNDSWNWSIDQSQEPQMQQQYVPTYQSLGQSQTPDNYYNSNGNRTTPSQPLLPPGNPPRASRESTPSLPKQDAYPHYPVPPSNVQPPPVNSVRQWGQERREPFEANQNNPYLQKPPLPPRQFEGNKYNWDGGETTPGQETWQNHVQPSNAYWQNFNAKEDDFKNVNNQWTQFAQSDNSHFANQNATQETEKPKTPIQTVPPSWHDEEQKHAQNQHPPPAQSWYPAPKDDAKSKSENADGRASQWKVEQKPVTYFSPPTPNSAAPTPDSAFIEGKRASADRVNDLSVSVNQMTLEPHQQFAQGHEAPHQQFTQGHETPHQQFTQGHEMPHQQFTQGHEAPHQQFTQGHEPPQEQANQWPSQMYPQQFPEVKPPAQSVSQAQTEITTSQHQEIPPYNDYPQSVNTQDHFRPQLMQPPANTPVQPASQQVEKPHDPPATYDQWYQNAAQGQNWYADRSQKQWTPPVSDLETCESIQPPVEFTTPEVAQPEESKALEIDAKPTPQPESQTQEPTPPENYEFSSNDRNTFLETGELTDSHHDQESAPSQEDENDEVPNDIPFLREVPGQSSAADARRNDPTGQEQYPPTGRDVPPGQERREGSMPRMDSDPLERRNDPSGRERSLPPVQSRNDPSGEERTLQTPQINLESHEIRQVPGSGTDPADSGSTDGVREIPGGVSPNEAAVTAADDRVVTGSQQYSAPVVNTMQETREEAVGASTRENAMAASGSPKRRDSYEDGDDEESGNSRDESRERQRERREPSPLPLEGRRRYDKSYYDHDREYDDDYYYDRRRADYDRPYNSREDLDRRDASYRDDRRHREDPDDTARRGRLKDEERDRSGKRDDRRGQRDRSDDTRRREGRDYGYMRDPRARDFAEPDRRRRRFEDYDRDHRRDYYDDPYARSSRPSSRSSYNDRERDYYMRSRDSYYGYNGYGSYDYGPNYNANYYAYLENLRRTNPVAYMEWYNKYYANQHAHQQQQQPSLSRGVPNYPEDRASVHSGQSSCDDRTPSGKHMLGDMSMMDDSRIISRMTPTKFSTSHVKGVFSIGSLVHVHASYPADGDRARVDVVSVDNLLLHDPIARELRAYPGPLIKGVTHKKTIIEYCEAKIKKAASSDRLVDRASYVLLYQLMIMIIQQNGNVVGVDIAALLLRNKEAYPHDASDTTKQRELKRRESILSQRSSGAGGDKSADESTLSPESEEAAKTEQPRKTIEQITNEFRNTLLYGLVQEALEYAMTEGLWGHALFLASKLDKRTHASVMTRFANSLSAQDPLQTLYQLHSGRVPASVTCLADSKWDDWRPHLAMIISNTSVNPEINPRSIATLGDTMAARGDIYAAHFCYILAEVDFGKYGQTGAKMVLIGSNHNKRYEEFVTLEAIMLTEIYEYARSLSQPAFTLVELQTFKFENAQKMVDYGLMEKALLYLEQIAVNIVNSPSKYKQSFVNSVYTLSERIKFHDPIFKDSIEEDGSLVWLNNLAELVGKCKTGEIVQDVFQSREMLADQGAQPTQEQPDVQHAPQNQWNYTHQEYADGGAPLMEVPTVDVAQDQWQHAGDQQGNQYAQNPETNHYATQPMQQHSQQDYWGQQGYTQPEYTDWQHQQSMPPQSYQSEQNDVDAAQSSGMWNYESEKEDKPSTPDPQPQISMGPTSGKQYDPLEELDALEQPRGGQKSADSTKKPVEKSNDKKTATSSGGSWFGGLFSKLTPKPKNQMILPDDNNPTIVWDPVAKKWTNKDEAGEGGSSSLAPPPKAADLDFKPTPMEPSKPTSQPAVGPPNGDEASAPNSSKILAGNNMFKLQKGRSMRANYIDVMNPNASKGAPAVPTPASSPPLVPMAASSPQLFIPAPVNDPNAPVNFLTPMSTAMPSADNTSQGLSRWSSTSSLSREVQSYTMRDPRTQQRTKGSVGYGQREEMKESSLRKPPRSRYQMR